jgi:hypothetical protein
VEIEDSEDDELSGAPPVNIYRQRQQKRFKLTAEPQRRGYLNG